MFLDGQSVQPCLSTAIAFVTDYTWNALRVSAPFVYLLLS